MSIIGARLIIPNAAAGYLKVIPKTAGYASALIGALQMIGSAFVSFIISSFSVPSQLLLALILISIGLLSLINFYFVIMSYHKNALINPTTFAS